MECKISAAINAAENQQTRQAIMVIASDPSTSATKAADMLKPFTVTKLTNEAITAHRNGVCACGPTGSLLAGLLAPTVDGFHQDAAARDRRFNHPSGWEPRVKMDLDGAPSEVVSVPVTQDTAEQTALTQTLSSMGVSLRPDQEAILVEVRQGIDWFRGEQGEDAVSRPSARLRWNIRFKPQSEAVLDTVEMENLWAQANKVSKKARLAAPAVERALIVAVADWQLGQADGDGLRGQVRRIAQIPTTMNAELARLKKSGTPVSKIIIAGLGDLVEGCDGFYANQAFTVQADRREQVKLARRLLLRIITAAAETGLEVVVVGVSGNHGENRSNGKMFTTPADNDDLAVFEQVYDIVDGRPGFENVTFSIPGDRLVATLAVYDHVLALTHGHILPGGGGGAAKKAEGWWAKQALAREAAGDADVLLAGHLHHFNVTDVAGRLFVQAPAACDKSQHFAERYGMVSRNGLLTFTVGAGSEQVDNLRIHRLDTEDILSGL